MESGSQNQVVLEVDNLSMRFGDIQALRAVTFNVHSGEPVAIIGPNGAGKTTLLAILAGIRSPTAGAITAPARGVGWVPQKQAVYSKLSVAENLRLFARLERIDRVEETVTAMLAQTGLGDRAHEELGHLSGGNQQRVNIAVGLLSKPNVLLLDEPSAALDPRQRERLWEFVDSLSDHGTTVVYSTHNLDEAEKHAHRVLVLADGELLFNDSPRALQGAVSAPGLDFETAFVQFLKEQGH